MHKSVFSFSIKIGVCFFFIFSTHSFGSNLTDNSTIYANYHFGKVLPEYNNFTYLINDNVRSIELSASKKTIGKNIWEKIYNYPSFGCSVYYSTLGNEKVFGRELAIFPYCDLYFVSRNKLNFFNRIGLGLGLVSEKYNEKSNYQNIAVGSHLNIHFNYRVGFNLHLFSKFLLSSGISFSHFSNGNFSEPNLGVNYLTVYGGVGYCVGKKTERLIVEKMKYEKSTVLEINPAIGGKHARALQSNFYRTSSLSIEYKWRKFRAFHFGVGADLFYDSSTKEEMIAVSNRVYKKKYDYRTGIHFSQELIYNKLGLTIQEGIYIGLTDEVNHKYIYSRAMVRYYFTSLLYANISMKSHLHILDFPELGMGIRF